MVFLIFKKLNSSSKVGNCYSCSLEMFKSDILEKTLTTDLNGIELDSKKIENSKDYLNILYEIAK